MGLSVVTTLAGGANVFADGSGTNAGFSGPRGVAIDARGNIYVADMGYQRIRKVSADGGTPLAFSLCIFFMISTAQTSR